MDQKFLLNQDVLTEIREAIIFSLSSTVMELKVAMTLPDISVLRVIVYKAVFKATKKRNIRVLEILLKQVIRKA